MLYRFGTAKPREPEDWLHLEWDLSSLFSGAPVDEEDLFAGRDSEIRRMMESVFERSRHAVLYGERGVGKTSMTNVFWRRFGGLKAVIAARVQADPSDTFASLWNKAIDEFASMAKSLGSYELAPVDNTISMETPDVVRRELQKCKPNATPIIVIDEFDKLKDENARLLTANVIKYLYDYSVNVTVVLVGVAEDVSSLIKDHESIDRALTQIRLNRMSDHELNGVIDKRLARTPVKISGDARWTIVTLSRGLPYFTQMLGKYSSINAVRGKRLVVSVDDVDKAMSQFIEDAEQKLDEAYRNATESNQKDALFREVLLACALSKSDPSGFFTPTDVIDPLTAIVGSKKRHAHFQRHLTEFLTDNRGKVLVRRGTERQYRYRFTDPMMQPYVIIRGIQDRLIDPASRKRLLEREQPQLAIEP
jgi:hypothetical protein